MSAATTGTTGEPIVAGQFGRMAVGQRGLVPCRIEAVTARGAVRVSPLGIGGAHWLPARQVHAGAIEWILGEPEVRDLELREVPQ